MYKRYRKLRYLRGKSRLVRDAKIPDGDTGPQDWKSDLHKRASGVHAGAENSRAVGSYM